MIPHNGKKCTIDGCNSLLFARGMCSYHYRINYSKGIKPKKKEIKYNVYGYDKEYDMFLDLWEKAKDKSGNVYCPISKQKLNHLYGTSFFVNCFAHILSKALNKYPKYRLNPDNIMVILPQAHNLIDHGSKSQRDNYDWDWNIFYDKREKLIEQYNKEFNK